MKIDIIIKKKSFNSVRKLPAFLEIQLISQLGQNFYTINSMSSYLVIVKNVALIK